MESPIVHVRLALNKLEKVALRYSRSYGRPPVLILNNIHYFNNDDEGRNMLLQLQQRAEAWAASGECNVMLTLTWISMLLSRDHDDGVQHVSGS